MNTLEVGADDEDDLKDIRLPMPNGSWNPAQANSMLDMPNHFYQ